MRSIQVIILAAGSGTRMKSELPKVLHPVCGRPMIAYALDLAAATGGGKQPIVVLGGETADAVKPHLPKDIVVVVQKTSLGTGDAVLQAKKQAGATGDVLILYADTLLIRRTTVQRLIESHFKSNSTCTMLTAHLADPSGYGRIVRDPAGAITGIVEESDANAAQRALREINVGPICIKAQPLFEALTNVKPSTVKKEWYLTQAVALLGAREGTKFQTVRVEEASEALGVNSRADLVRATGIIRQRILEMHLHNGVTIVDPATTYIDQGVTIGHDTVIQPCTVIETGVTIGKRCSIGPFARLRSGTAVSDHVRIGNFAELVRTKLGQHVRMLHMSYLGDTTVEDDVNIGAGTITANYDGKNKLPTQIGKGAFIGSDTILIAPVKIGAGAVTGAGSVVTKSHDVPPKGVVVGVPAHAISPGASNGTKPVEKAPAARPALAAKPKPRLAAKPKSKSKAKLRPKAKATAKPRRLAVKARRAPARGAGGHRASGHRASGHRAKVHRAKTRRAAVSSRR